MSSYISLGLVSTLESLEWTILLKLADSAGQFHLKPKVCNINSEHSVWGSVDNVALLVRAVLL